MGAANSKPGAALIFSHEKFYHETELSNRDGNEADVCKLRNILTTLGFSLISSQLDCSFSEISRTIKQLAQRDNSNEYSCLVVIVLTHGGREGVLWAKDEAYHTKDVWEPFIHCPKFKNKPKIFLFQACRGENEETRVANNSEGNSELNVKEDMFFPVTPHSPDFLLVHSTVEDKVSKRDPKTGTIYVTNLCNWLEIAISQQRPMDILTLLTKVNKDVTSKHPQTATFTSFLHSPVLVVSSKRNQPSTSQSPLCDESSKRNQPSTSQSPLCNDGQGSLPTEYPRNGKIISVILYTSYFEKKAKLMQDRLENLPGSVIKLYENMDKCQKNLIHRLNEVFKSNDPILSEADTLLFMVICQQFQYSKDYCEKLYVTFSGNKVPINSIWGTSTAKNCQWLQGKPKLFFFCEPHCTDAGVSEEVPTSNSETVTNQSDFLRMYCYGIEIFNELLSALENPRQEITQMLTSLMCKSEQKLAKSSGRFSHFESTLTMSAYLSLMSQKQSSMAGVENVYVPSILQSSLNVNTVAAVEDENVPSIQSSFVVSEADASEADANKHRYTKFGTPLERSYTNIVSLVCFISFGCGWIAIAIIAFMTGDLQRLSYPVDYVGQRCGLDEVVQNKPYLFYFNITECGSPDTISAGCPTTQICLATCPGKNNLLNASRNVNGLIDENSVCKYVVTDKQRSSFYPALTEEEIVGNCSRGYWASTPFLNHCLPSSLLNDAVNKSNPELWLKIKNENFFGMQMFNAVANIVAHAKIAEYYAHLREDVTNSWPFILLGLFESAVLSFIYVFVLRWIAMPMVWINLIGVFTATSYGIYVCYERWKTQESCSISQFLSPNVTGVCDKSLESYFLMGEMWITLLMVCCILIIVISLKLFFLRFKISVAIDLIRQAGKSVAEIRYIHFLPTVPCLLHLAVLTFSSFVWLFLLSSRISEDRVTEYKESCHFSSYKKAECDVASTNESCKQTMECLFHTFSSLPGIGWLHAYNIIGAICSSFFIFAFQDMVLAGSFSKWYWTTEGNDLSHSTLPVTMLQIVRYKVGTLALGIVLNSVCGLLRLIPDRMNYHNLNTCPDFVVVRQNKGCCNSMFQTIEDFLFFLNHACILCAIHGYNLQNSAKDTLQLLKKEKHRVDKIPYFLLFLAKLFLTLIAMVQWSLIFSNNKLNYFMFPVFIIGLGTYFIASLFFRVYSTAIDTLFILYLEDCEWKVESEEKPYRMSPETRELFQKMEG